MDPNERVEEKKYYTIEEVEKLLGKSRATIYNRMKLIDLKTHRFPYDRKTYIAAPDVERIKEVFNQPWIASEEGNKEGNLPGAA
jgi:predicted DNA-binding transcriptional regulator AlpA